MSLLAITNERMEVQLLTAKRTEALLAEPGPFVIEAQTHVVERRSSSA